jgi:hypothetical protein
MAQNNQKNQTDKDNGGSTRQVRTAVVSTRRGRHGDVIPVLAEGTCTTCMGVGSYVYQGRTVTCSHS